MAANVRKAKAGVVTTPTKKSKFSFFGEVIGELKKVRWPTRQEITRLSVLVLVICILAGAILGALDYGFAQMMRHFFMGS